MKIFFTYLLLTIFSFQVLPVKEIGKLLYKGFMTEEIQDNECSNEEHKVNIIKKEAEVYKPGYIYATLNAKGFSRLVTLAIKQAEHLPRQFVPDILTPPPNALG